MVGTKFIWRPPVFLVEMGMSDLLIVNGHVIDPASGVDGPRDVLVRDGRIAAVEMPGGLAALLVAESEWMRRGWCLRRG